VPPARQHSPTTHVSSYLCATAAGWCQAANLTLAHCTWQAPAFLTEPQYSDVFVAKARLIAREADGWYQAPEAAEQSVAANLTGAMAA